MSRGPVVDVSVNGGLLIRIERMLGPAELRAESRSPHMLAAVLDHMLQDESMLLVFCASDGIPPEDIAPAQRALAKMAGEIGDPESSV